MDASGRDQERGPCRNEMLAGWGRRSYASSAYARDRNYFRVRPELLLGAFEDNCCLSPRARMDWGRLMSYSETAWRLGYHPHPLNASLAPYLQPSITASKSMIKKLINCGFFPPEKTFENRKRIATGVTYGKKYRKPREVLMRCGTDQFSQRGNSKNKVTFYSVVRVTLMLNVYLCRRSY